MPPSPVRFRCSPYSVTASGRLAAELGVSAPVAAILTRRGFASAAEAQSFLAGEERHDPFAFAGMKEACTLVLDHARRGSRIVVHGDYDVDGIASTAILVRTLRRLGADPGWHLPSRFDGGYGLSVATVDRLAAQGTGLLITTDCGITSAAEVDHARALGLDVVVTDHHRPAERLPACPIVHPGVGGYPFAELCAAGVVHKLSEALHASAGEDPALAAEDLDLVALATVADLVPLRGENRRLVREGLRAIARTRKPGLRALMRVAALEPAAVDAHCVGFRLAPRLNAAGRLRRADAALELVLTEDEERAAQVADELDLLNAERRGTETEILMAAEAARTEHPEAPAYVLAGEGWHPGVIGIVASRMVERHHRPCVLIALDGDGGKGSGRSIPGYDLHAGLASCAGLLRRFGGHRAAAGLEIDAAQVESFRSAFIAHAQGELSEEDLTPLQHVDAVVPAGALGLPLAEELGRLEPFGMGNPRPTLLVPAARVSDVRGMGQEGEHARFTLSSGGRRARVVAFGTPPDQLAGCGEDPYDIAATLAVNEWNGAVEPRLTLRAVAPTRPGRCRVLDEAPFWSVVERELSADAPVAAPAAAHRLLIDRRHEGIAGALGDLISSGEPALVVCADVPRRRAGLERLVAGLCASLGGEGADAVALTSWDALVADPSLAAPYPHLVALDPPPGPAGETLLAAAPGGASAVACWGAPEAEFAALVARASLDLRPALEAIFRGLREAGAASGAALERLLRGDGAHPRPAAACGRVLRVLRELGLVAYDAAGDDGPSCRALDAAPTTLERSAAWRSYQRLLEGAERYLAGAALRERLGEAAPAPAEAAPAAATAPEVAPVPLSAAPAASPAAPYQPTLAEPLVA